MMRPMSAEVIKTGVDRRLRAPKQGTKLRAFLDDALSDRGAYVEEHGGTVRVNCMATVLRDQWNIDVRRVGKGLYRVVG